jgi:cobaltochelatase CobS
MWPIPTEEIDVREVFGIDTDMRVKGNFAERSDRVPEIDTTYKFDPDTDAGHPGGFSPTTAG